MNSFSVFEEDDDIEFIYPTSNPLRKWKKKLRKKKQKYEKNPSPELNKEIMNIEKIIKNLLTPPKPKKKKKFKKKKRNKADEFKKRKAKRERESRERYNKFMFEAEFKRRRKEDTENLQKKYLMLMRNNKNNSIPKELKLFIRNPNKKRYAYLSRKYHPDKATQKKQLLLKLLFTLPEDLVDIIWSFYYNKELHEHYCRIILGFWNDLNKLDFPFACVYN